MTPTQANASDDAELSTRPNLDISHDLPYTTLLVLLDISTMGRLREIGAIKRSLYELKNNLRPSQERHLINEIETERFLESVIPISDRLEALRDIFLQRLESRVPGDEGRINEAYEHGIEEAMFILPCRGDIIGVEVPGWMLTVEDVHLKKQRMRRNIKSFHAVGQWKRARAVFPTKILGEDLVRNEEKLNVLTRVLRNIIKDSWPKSLGNSLVDKETRIDGNKSIFCWELPEDLHSTTFTCASYYSNGAPMFLDTQHRMRKLNETAVHELAGTHGRIWYIRHPSINLSIWSLCFILCQLDFYVAPQERKPNFNRSLYSFLDAYIGPWSPVTVRSGSCINEAGFLSLQYHFRVFSRVQKPLSSLENLIEKGFKGVRCHRALGGLPSLRQTHDIGIAESRCSIAISSAYIAERPLYSITYLSDSAVFTEGPTQGVWESLGFVPCGRLTCVAVFLASVFSALCLWKDEWTELLNIVDHALELQVSDILNRESRKKLMFDETFDRAESYFTVLQLLPVCREWIEESEQALARLRSDFKMSFESEPHPDVRKEDLSSLLDNWDKVLAWQRSHSRELSSRIKRKCEEVERLRDALVNVTALREASKGTALNRYIMVFTITTIFYLPLSFVAAIFSMNLFNTEDTIRNRHSFYITIVVVSVVTYIASGIAIMRLHKHGQQPRNKSFADNSLYGINMDSLERINWDEAHGEKAGFAAMFRRRKKSPPENAAGVAP